LDVIKWLDEEGKVDVNAKGVNGAATYRALQPAKLKNATTFNGTGGLR
jgi:hypothetical protein